MFLIPVATLIDQALRLQTYEKYDADPSGGLLKVYQGLKLCTANWLFLA